MLPTITCVPLCPSYHFTHLNGHATQHHPRLVIHSAAFNRAHYRAMLCAQGQQATHPPLFCLVIQPLQQQKYDATRDDLQKDMTSQTCDMHNECPRCCHHWKAVAVLSTHVSAPKAAAVLFIHMSAPARNGTGPHHLWIGSSACQLHQHRETVGHIREVPGS